MESDLAFLGLLSLQEGRPSRAKATSPGFSRVTMSTPRAIEEPRFRIELPNGAVLEWSGAASVGPVGDLIERMARLP
jgi:hypothetical protein